MKILYTYIINPRKAFTFYGKETPYNASWLALILASWTAALFSIPESIFEFITLTLLFTILNIFFIFIYSLIVDFFSQFISKTTGKSLNLFHWFSLSLLPFCIFVPLRSFSITMPIFDPIYSMIYTLTFFIVILLQIYTVRKLYRLSLVKSAILFASPFILFASMLLLLLFFSGLFFIQSF